MTPRAEASGLSNEASFPREANRTASGSEWSPTNERKRALLTSKPNLMDLKLQTARTLKWNAIDRVATQVLYAVVGVVLANILSPEEFGLVGVLLIFQAFATILVDSGFGAALLREKDPTQQDYSTVFWFNLIVSLAIYAILFAGAPLIAEIFQGQQKLIPMSKVMFLTFVINGAAIVQVNRLMKKMDVRMIAVSNSAGLIISGIAAIWLALRGAGAWALVWQNIILASVKTLTLWSTGHWRPSLCFSKATIRKIRAVGFSVFSSSLLNTISLNIYNFVIGAFYNIVSLGVYTQADKWSKMGSASLSQILTSSFVPLLSKVQDSKETFHRYVDKTGRFTAFILLPAMTLLAVMAEPLFHLLFGNKWDAAIPLFSILSVRGIFVVLISLYSNYLLSLGKARNLFASEAVKDTLIFVAILATIFLRDITWLIIGQLCASIATWILLIPLTSRSLGMPSRRLLTPLLPFALASVALAAVALAINNLVPPILDSRIFNNGFILLLQLIGGAGVYLLLLRLMRTPELPEALTYLLGRFRRPKT